MKPAPFAYHAPRSVEEALALLGQHGDDARILAGGQTLGPLLNMRLATPAVIVDLNEVAELAFRRGGDGGLQIGAMTRESALEDDPAVAEHQPLVAAAIPFIAHRAVRNRGTVGGSLAHADPAAEWGGLVAALDVELVLRRVDGGTRTLVGSEEFFRGALTTAIEPDELLVEIRLPPWPPGRGWAFLEFSRRHGDFALAGVLAHLDLDEEGRCLAPRIALFGVGDVPVRARSAERVLDAQTPRAEVVAEAAATAAAELEPTSDVHASAEYRRHLAQVLVGRAIEQAVRRARAGVTRGDDRHG